MNKVFISIILMCIYSSELYSAEHNQIKIKIVDTHNKPFNAQTLRWWHADERKTKYTLSCNQKECSEWFLVPPLFERIVISADASTPDTKDSLCWRLYHGEASLTPRLKNVEIVMRFNNIACN